MRRAVRAICVLAIIFTSGYGVAQNGAIRESWSFLLVPVSSDDGCPTERADAPLADLRRLCSDFVAKAQFSKKGKAKRNATQLANSCIDKYDELYLSVLQSKYSRADFAQVAEQFKTASDASQLECLLATSHNERVSVEIDEKQAQFDAAEKRLNDDLDRIQAARSAMHTSEAREEGAGRKALRSLAAGLHAFGQALAPSGRRGGGASCRSDFDCQYGFGCVKAPGKIEGYCAQKVNQYKNPTFAPPDPDSVNPGGEGQCGFDAECTPGFYCAKEPGAVRGACLAR